MNLTKELFDHLKELTGAAELQNGCELFNPIPLKINTGLTRPLTLKEQIQRCLRQELSEQAAAQGYETFAENNDFEMPNEDFDDNIISRYELMDDDYPAPTLGATSEPPPPDATLREGEVAEKMPETDEKE